MATYPGGYIAEVAGLSPKATEKDLYNFFSYCGAIEHVEIIRDGERACTAYVSFGDAYALETAVLLSGATIVDQTVCIISWGSHSYDSYPWDGPSWNHYDSSSVVTHENQFVSSHGEAVTVAQEMVKTMIAKGYVLGKDALVKAKAFDESHRVSATAAAKVVDVTKLVASVTGSAAVTAATYTGRTAKAAANAVVNSSYFARGALWVSDVLTRAAKAAADMGSQANKPTGQGLK